MTFVNKLKSFTPRQEAFINEYPRDLNATRAAIRAGYAQSSAYQRGYELVRNADIQQRLRGLGLMGLDTLAEMAVFGNNDAARVRAAIALVERAYGKPQPNS